MNYSVALCTYNGESYVEDQIQSILNQTNKPKEIVICDDASTDSTIRIIDAIISANSAIKWQLNINKTNIGYVNNFQEAIKLCSNEIIFLADQDDIWKENKAQIILDAFELKPNVNVLFSNGEILADDESLNGQTLFENKNFSVADQKLFKRPFGPLTLLFNKSFVVGATMAFRASFRDRFLPINQHSNFIHDSWISIIAACDNSIDFIHEKLIIYRVHSNNQIGAKTRLKHTSYSATNFIREELIKNASKEVEVYSFIEQQPFSFDQIQLLQKRKLFLAKCQKQNFKKSNLIDPRLFLNKFYHYHTLKLYLKNTLKVLFNR